MKLSTPLFSHTRIRTPSHISFILTVFFLFCIQSNVVLSPARKCFDHVQSVETSFIFRQRCRSYAAIELRFFISPSSIGLRGLVLPDGCGTTIVLRLALSLVSRAISPLHSALPLYLPIANRYLSSCIWLLSLR